MGIGDQHKEKRRNAPMREYMSLRPGRADLEESFPCASSMSKPALQLGSPYIHNRPWPPSAMMRVGHTSLPASLALTSIQPTEAEDQQTG